MPKRELGKTQQGNGMDMACCSMFFFCHLFVFLLFCNKLKCFGKKIKIFQVFRKLLVLLGEGRGEEAGNEVLRKIFPTETQL